MKTPESPRTNALYGMFLQDVGRIKVKHPRCFRKKYHRFDLSPDIEHGYYLRIEPDDFPKSVRKEIIQTFNHRLNAEQEHPFN